MSLPLLLGLGGCIEDYEPIAFEADGETLIAVGIVDERALSDFRDAITANPGIETLVLEWVPGSADDDSNLQLARIVHSMGLETVVPPGGLVASGGTDLFLAGATRTIATDACVGVHAWGDDEAGSGADVPRDDPVHALYLRYYEDIGIDPAFYWYTMEAAGADEMHWMSARERRAFAMATEPALDAGAAPDAVACEDRVWSPPS